MKKKPVILHNFKNKINFTAQYALLIYMFTY